MLSEPTRPKLEIGDHCRKLGLVLYVLSLALPIGYSAKNIDEFGHLVYGFECLIAAVASLLPSHYLSITLAAWVNPFVLLVYLIDEFGFVSQYRSLIPYLETGTFAGLIASYFALAHEQFQPRSGYWIWITSILLIILPTLYRWKLSLKPLTNPDC